MVFDTTNPNIKEEIQDMVPFSLAQLKIMIVEL